MARLLVCTQSERVLARVRDLCASVGWDVERGALDDGQAEHLGFDGVDAAFFHFARQDGPESAVLDQIARQAPFFPIVLMHRDGSDKGSPPSGAFYSVQLEHLDDLEHILISLSCAGYSDREGGAVRGAGREEALRILVVDRDASVASGLGRILRSRADADVHIANSGFQACAMLLFLRPRVVIINMALPDVDGSLLCAYIRAHADFQDTWVVAVDPSGRVKAAPEDPAGFHAVVRTPCGIEEALQDMETLAV